MQTSLIVLSNHRVLSKTKTNTRGVYDTMTVSNKGYINRAHVPHGASVHAPIDAVCHSSVCYACYKPVLYSTAENAIKTNGVNMQLLCADMRLLFARVALAACVIKCYKIITSSKMLMCYIIAVLSHFTKPVLYPKSDTTNPGLNK